MTSFSLFVHNYLMTTSPDAENAPIILTGVLLSLVFIYIASKAGHFQSRVKFEFSNRF